MKVVKSVDVAAPVDKTWDAVKDFDSLDKWHPASPRMCIQKGENNKPGAVRKLTVKDGPSFTEELLAFDEAKHTYKLPHRRVAVAVAGLCVTHDGYAGAEWRLHRNLGGHLQAQEHF